MGAPLPPCELNIYDNMLKFIKDGLDQHQYEISIKQGQNLTLEQATTIALFDA